MNMTTSLDEHLIAASGASGVLQTLIDYSVGKLPRAVALKELGLNDYGSLLQLMSVNRLPLPIVPISRRKVMAQEFVALVTGAE